MGYANIYLEGMTAKLINYLYVLETVFNKKENERLINLPDAMVKLRETYGILNTICKNFFHFPLYYYNHYSLLITFSLIITSTSSSFLFLTIPTKQ